MHVVTTNRTSLDKNPFCHREKTVPKKPTTRTTEAMVDPTGRVDPQLFLPEDDANPASAFPVGIEHGDPASMRQPPSGMSQHAVLQQHHQHLQQQQQQLLDDATLLQHQQQQQLLPHGGGGGASALGAFSLQAQRLQKRHQLILQQEQQQQGLAGGGGVGANALGGGESEAAFVQRQQQQQTPGLGSVMDSKSSGANAAASGAMGQQLGNMSMMNLSNRMFGIQTTQTPTQQQQLAQQLQQQRGLQNLTMGQNSLYAQQLAGGGGAGTLAGFETADSLMAAMGGGGGGGSSNAGMGASSNGMSAMQSGDGAVPLGMFRQQQQQQQGGLGQSAYSAMLEQQQQQQNAGLSLLPSRLQQPGNSSQFSQPSGLGGVGTTAAAMTGPWLGGGNQTGGGGGLFGNDQVASSSSSSGAGLWPNKNQQALSLAAAQQQQQLGPSTTTITGMGMTGQTPGLDMYAAAAALGPTNANPTALGSFMLPGLIQQTQSRLGGGGGMPQQAFSHQQQLQQGGGGVVGDSLLRQGGPQQVLPQHLQQKSQLMTTQLLLGGANMNDPAVVAATATAGKMRRRSSSLSSAGSLSGDGGGEEAGGALMGNMRRPNTMLENQAFAAQQGQIHPSTQTSMGVSFGAGGGYGGNMAEFGMVPSFMQPMMNTDAEQTVKRKEKKRRAKTFPEKLMEAMMDHSKDDTVAWLPDGKSFVIVSPELFVKDVLNRVFKEAKYASFIRKLHRWNFVRLTSGTGTDCFHHPLFQRGRKDLVSKISCSTREKEIGRFKSASPTRTEKPPSLAGVEKFIRAKAAAAAAAAAAIAGDVARIGEEGAEGSSDTVDADADAEDPDEQDEGPGPGPSEGGGTGTVGAGDDDQKKEEGSRQEDERVGTDTSKGADPEVDAVKIKVEDQERAPVPIFSDDSHAQSLYKNEAI